MPASNHAFSAFSFITFILVLIPSPWHLEAWNTGTVLYIAWVAIANLIYFVNSVVWDRTAINYAPVWCDISTKLMIGASVGIPCAALCINRRLYYIASVQTVTTSRKDRTRAMIMDMSICIGVPIIIMALHYVVQGHRFDIYQELGCKPAIYNVTLQYVLLQAPMILIPVLSAVYGVMGVLCFRKRQVAFKQMLASSSSSLTTSRYWRLMALASLDVVIGLPLTLMVAILSATLNPVQPWISWEDTHADFSAVRLVPSVLWRSSSLAQAMLELNRYMPVICGLIFFAFFGTGEEAFKKYTAVVDKICRLVGISNPLKKAANTKSFNSSFGTGSASTGFAKFKVSTPGTEGNGSNAALPIYVEKEVINKRDSFDTMSDFSSLQSGRESGGKMYPIGLTNPSHNTSTTQSRSSSPTSEKPRIEISSALFPGSEDVEKRAPESSFPVPATPEATSFLEMATPVADGMLSSKPPHYTRADNRV